MRKLFSQIVRNEETVYAESEELRNYFGEFCTNQSSLHGETLFGDVNCWAGRRSQLVVKDSTITAFGRSILVWPTPGSPSHQKHGTLLLDTCSNVYSLVLVEAVCTFAYQRLRACMAFGMSDAE